MNLWMNQWMSEWKHKSQKSMLIGVTEQRYPILDFVSPVHYWVALLLGRQFTCLPKYLPVPVILLSIFMLLELWWVCSFSFILQLKIICSKTKLNINFSYGTFAPVEPDYQRILKLVHLKKTYGQKCVAVRGLNTCNVSIRKCGH